MTEKPNLEEEVAGIKAAWEVLKPNLAPENWTTSESFTYYGFFAWGWEARRQYDQPVMRENATLKQELSGCHAVNEVANKEIERLQAEIEQLRDENSRLKHELNYPLDEIVRL